MESLTNYKTVCSKYDIHLKRSKLEDTYMISFTSENTNNINIANIMNFKIYNLIYELNKDVLDAVKIIEQPADDKVHVLFLFKQFGKELGLKKKYMFIETTAQKKGDIITFSSKSIPYNDNLGKDYDRVHNDFSELYANVNNKHKVDILYKFKIDMYDNLPIYMENLMGLLMKKIFYRLKIFIENLK